MQRTLTPILLILALIACAFSIPTTGHASPDDVIKTGERKAILITGASSGIGRVTAEHLAANGYFVYAGARKPADIDELSAIDNIQGIRLDVTRQDEIDAAVQTVKAGGRGLHGLINNAGVGLSAPLIEIDMDDLHWIMDVNVYGPVRVTKAFAPLLIESKGRISTTGSIAGIIAYPFGGSYCMTKHAIEAYTDALATELESFGVSVSVVDPGGFKSEIGINAKRRLAETGYTAEGSLYQEQMEQRLARSGDRSNLKEPIEVAEAFYHAMTDPNPKRRYMVTPNKEQAEWTIGGAINRVVQLNADQPYEFTREELIAMLDEAMMGQAGD